MEKEVSTKRREDLLNTLKARFEKNMNRYKVSNRRTYKQG